MSTTWGPGYKFDVVDASLLHPNPWNPNRESPETFEKVKASIRNHEMVEPVTVRQLANGDLQIVNGEHRWRAHLALGISTIPVVNLGDMPDSKAKRLTVLLNELRGAPDPVRLGDLLREVSLEVPISELLTDLPMSEVEVESLINFSTPVDFGDMVASDHSNPQPRDKLSLGGTKKFQLGKIKADVPVALHDALIREFERSSAACGTANPEVVLQDVLDRLEATVDQVDVRISERPQVEQKKTRPKKGGSQ